MEHRELVLQAAAKLDSGWREQTLLLGFDGFIDEIIQVVDERESPDRFTRLQSINAFSERIARASGLSSNLELVPVDVKLGGNGPIMANALKAQDYKIFYIGSLGKDEINPVFRDFVQGLYRVVSLADPGHTDALEFYDGKIMLGKMNCLQDVNWNNLIEMISEQELTDILSETALVCFTNWTMLIGMNSIIEGFSGILGRLRRPPLVFIDLADPQKRTREDILEVLNMISQLEKQTQVILGMNRHESSLVLEVLEKNEENIAERAVLIRSLLGISAVVIHPVDGAAVATPEMAAWLNGPYTLTPRLTTGAGDNFNAGFCHAWLCDLSPQECLAVGVGTSGFYVRNGYSPSRQELTDFMRRWVSV